MAVCNHPACPRISKRSWCGRHWHDLPGDLQKRLKSCRSPEEKRAMLLEARQYFAEERMIGDLEITTCRGRAPAYDGCGADIVWLVTQNGKKMPVDAETISKGDEVFDHSRHRTHWGTCPKAKGFRG